LVVYADAPLTLPRTLEGFQPVAGQRSEVFQARGCVQPIKPHLGLSPKTGKLPNTLAIGEALGSFVR
jgi:hypothetical protein